MSGDPATPGGLDPVPPINAAIGRMEAIAAGLPVADGVARFNDLYLAVTREVLATAGNDAFEDPAFIAHLDLSFAGRYFEAYDADLGGRDMGSAWWPLFEARSRPGTAPIQFALAGMNAHINFDLCIALVETHRELGVPIQTGTARHRDYLRVNAILELVEETVKERLATGILDLADEALGRLDDVLAMWSVGRARDAAWAHAEVLEHLQGIGWIADRYTDTLGHVVGFAGRGLLLAVLPEDSI